MELIDQFKALGKKAQQLEGKLQTEEATKNALVLPFIQLLDYDVFNPEEVVPEFQAEAGVKKDQRVDFALCKEGHPVILIECKKLGSPLDNEAIDQLCRYFPHVTSARVGILTDGRVYRLFSDLEKDNIMDMTPYMEFSVDNISEDVLGKIILLAKTKYNDEEAVHAAEELKYTKAFKAILSKQYESPEDDFVRFFGKQVWNGQLTQNVKDKLTPLLKEAFRQWTEDRINSRLRKAIEGEEQEKAKVEPVPEPTVNEPNENEILGLNIVKAILSSVCDPNRLTLRLLNDYSAVCIDDSRRKTLIRFYFRTPVLKIDLYGYLKVEPPFKIDQVSDIYNYKDRIVDIFNWYQNKSPLEKGNLEQDNSSVDDSNAKDSKEST